MNDSELKSLLQKFIKHQLSDWKPECKQYHNCTSFLESSVSGDICFYYLNDGKEEQERLKQRLSLANASLIIFNKNPDFPVDVFYIVVEESRWIPAQVAVCDRLYPMNLCDKKIIGVTGTNGKTSTVYFGLQILEQIGIRGFSIGSLGVRDSKGLLSDNRGMTTPPYVELRKTLHRHFKDYDVCMMEVSSHGLAQDRVHGLSYDVAGWTSFSHDHLDYHQSLEEYFEQKLKFPQKYLKRDAPKLLVPRDNYDLIKRLKSRIAIELTKDLASLGVNCSADYLKVPFNRNNLELAANLIASAYKMKQLSFEPQKLTTPPGRFEIVECGPMLAVIDSAHTPDAIAKTLLSIKKIYPQKKILTVFGCGGNRDSKKRPLMGGVVEKNCDIAIVTSDNPRFENPQSIIDDIISGMQGSYRVEINREKAIAMGISLLGENSVLAILGKGCEEYQLIKSQKIKFSDREKFLELARSRECHG